MESPSRRRFLGTAAMTMAAVRLGMADDAQPTVRVSREFAAIGRGTHWISSAPLTAASLDGKAVLVQFCTYTCINWLRTLPYIRAWTRKYHETLIVIGVHTPEFEFEHAVDNVRRAMRQMNVEYPIVIDNDYAIWRAFGNQYWPALYLLDGRGRIQHQHFGEGQYQQSELAMHRLMFNRATTNEFVSVTGTGVEAPADWSNLRSAETYLGAARMESSPLQRTNSLFAGAWTIGRQAARLNRPSGRINQRFHARDLHLVMGPSQPGSRIRFRVSLDGHPPADARGLDIDGNGAGVVAEQRMYQLIRQPGRIVDRHFSIEFLDAGVDAFAFTFG